MSVQQYLFQDPGNLTAVGAFVFLYAGGFLIPVPYDTLFVIVGYSAAAIPLPLPGVLLAAALATFAGDTTAFFLARGGHRLGKTIGIGKRVSRVVRRQMDRHAGKTVFVTRMLPGVRLFGTIAAASTKMTYRRFLGYDLPAGLISGAVFLLLGYYLHESLDVIVADVTVAEHAVTVGIVVAIVIAVAYALVRWLASGKDADEDLPVGHGA